MGNDADSLHESAGLTWEIGEGEIDCSVGVVVIKDAPIDIVLEFDGHKIFGVAFFEVAHVADPVVEGEVVDEGVEVEMVILSKARDFEIAHPDGGVTAEDQHRLGFIGVLSQVLHDLIGRHRHLLHVFLPEVVLPLDEVYH